MNRDSQWSKQEACFACATHVWLAVNHNTSVTSGEYIYPSLVLVQPRKTRPCLTERLLMGQKKIKSIKQTKHLANEFDVRSELHGQVSLPAVNQSFMRL